MNFSQLESYLQDLNMWHNIDGTNDFIYENDIFFNIKFGAWLEVNSPSTNLGSFFYLLKERQTNNLIECAEVNFFYKNQLVNKSLLYKFVGDSGTGDNGEELKQTVYFCKPSDKTNEDKINDIFSKGLILMMNDRIGLNFIKHAYGELH